MAAASGSTEAIRARLAGRVDGLNVKESNLVDLAADGDLPKGKIREKLIGIRDERGQIQQELARLGSELEVGREVFRAAVALLDQPQALYEQAGPTFRRLILQTIITKLEPDGNVVTGDLPAKTWPA